ncbi:universal stress protein [Peterkaempfera bronchialis]|uniref:universal stress protein n=1 Tax=Peterkaempfera bronchialis TaxID=2126346 RepID=UPI001E3C3914|nr:universal stress protein [Peterkaempfera bronchialis]
MSDGPASAHAVGSGVATPVVVGVDGSMAALHAVDWAVDEAAARGRPLRVVHASPWDRYETDATDNPELAQARTAAAELVGEAVRRAVARRPGVEVGSEPVAADAATALVAEAHRACLVVVGSRGHGGFAGMLLGSIGLQVAARAVCPVVVVRGGDAAERRHRRIVLGIGGHGEADGPAAAFAFAEAADWQARLEVVHARHSELDRLLGAVHRAHRGDAAAEARRVLEEAVADAVAAHPEVRVALHPVPDRAAHAALLAAAVDADLLVVGSHRRRRPTSLHLGPVDHAVLHHAHCPVAVVPAR